MRSQNNVLVTGTAGFIVTHLIKELLKIDKNTVIDVDNFYSGTNQKNLLKELVKVLNIQYSKSMIPKYLESRKGDIKESICDNTKIKQFLGFESFISFEEGILKL